MGTVKAAPTIASEDDGLGFRERYEKETKDAKAKYRDADPEFPDDDMNDAIPEADRKRGWHYPLTKSMQKKEYGCVVAEQQRFLWRLRDGHLDIVEDYLGDPKKKMAIDEDSGPNDEVIEVLKAFNSKPFIQPYVAE